MSLNFSENFKQLRKEKGDTQEKIAEVLGVTGQTVSRWELSICYPDLELLPSIANYFGVTVDTLLSNDNNSKEKDREIFYEKIYSFDFKNSTESIDFARGYCRKYPDDDQYAYELVCCINLYAAGNEERTARFMPILLKTAEKLLETRYKYLLDCFKTVRLVFEFTVIMSKRQCGKKFMSRIKITTPIIKNRQQF